MKIENLTTESLREYMGPAASEQDARRMMIILARELIENTRDVPNAQWDAWCIEATRTVTPENL